MFINITIETKDRRQDIRIDSDQRICEGLAVLQESGKLPNGPVPDYYRSRLNQRPVSAYMTFAEEQIYDGDILTAIVDPATVGSIATSAIADSIATSSTTSSTKRKRDEDENGSSLAS